MPATMDPFLRAYTGTVEVSAGANNVPVSRQHSFLDELDNVSVSSGRRTSIASDRKSSLGSDSLWGDARRLSEAGVRRTSDSSVVLTEDTDSFIIGDRVWVGGTKPGTIAYIGETQFAPGEWAGIVLDQPIGKNDGAVANVRYFQCDAKRGIFSRLTRLTRAPLQETDESGPPTPTSMHSRPPSAASSGRDLKVGDRVIVMSSTGSKAGMLRYLGKTDFAAGDWCGVECDDPVGKNNGSVQGKRYFTCEAQHGLFAPVAKVSLSPSPNRRPSCAVHQPLGPSRQNTQSSLSSTSSRVSAKPSRPGVVNKAASATNSHEAVLKDKEVYIEQLLKERDMERLAVTRAATQAEEAERQVDVLRQELRQTQEIAEATQADLQHQVSELLREKQDLSNEMEEIRNRLEDTTFRFEEDHLARADAESSRRELAERVRHLEQSLAEETRRADALEEVSNRLFEADESLARLRVTLDEKEATLQSTTSQLQQLQAEYSSSTKHESESQKQKIAERDEEITKLKSTNEEVNQSLAAVTLQLADARHSCLGFEEKCTQLTLQNSKLETKVSELMKSSSDSSQQLAKLNDALLEKEKECGSLREAAAELQRQSDLSLLTVQQQLQAAQANAKAEIESLKKTFKESMASIEKENENVSLKLSNACKDKEQLDQQMNELKETLEDLKNSKNDLQYKWECEMRHTSRLELDLENSMAGAGQIEVGLQERVKLLEREKNNLVEEIKSVRSQGDELKKELLQSKKTEEDLKQNMNVLNNEKEALNAKYEDKIKLLSSTIDSLRAEKEKSINLISEKDVDIVQLQQSIKALIIESEKKTNEIKSQEEKIKYVTDELEKSKLAALSSTSETEQVQGKLQEELRLMMTAKNELEKAVAGKESMIMNLESELQESKRLMQQSQENAREQEALYLSAKQSLEEKCMANDKILAEAKENILSLENEITKTKAFFTDECSKLKKEKESLEVKVKASLEIEKQLKESHDKIVQELLGNKQSEIERLRGEVDAANMLKAEVEQSTEEIKRLTETERNMNSQVEALEKQLRNSEEAKKKTEVQLHEYTKKMLDLEKQVEITSRENKELKNKIEKNKSELSNTVPVEATNNNTTDGIDTEMTINFLNGIIGDLQRKMEKQSEELTELRALVPPPPPARTRIITPRMFCDICDCFDLHDTEDCPHQADDSPLPQQTHNLPRGFQRPYCDHCEMFGHDTKDCDEETY